MRNESRFKYVQPRMSRMKMRVPTLDLSDDVRLHPDVVERRKLYNSDRWRRMRIDMLKEQDLRKCFFCHTAWSAVLEHIVGHGEDAVEVGHILGFNNVDPDWRTRFWDGPFVGSCRRCASSRSGAEAAGRLVAWTRKWREHNAAR